MRVGGILLYLVEVGFEEDVFFQDFAFEGGEGFFAVAVGVHGWGWVCWLVGCCLSESVGWRGAETA